MEMYNTLEIQALINRRKQETERLLQSTKKQVRSNR